MIVNPLQCLKRNRSQRYDYLRIQQRNRALKKIRAISKFAGGGSPVGACSRTRIAQGRTGNKNFVSLQVDRGQESFEVSTRLIAGKRNSRTICSLSPRSLADKHDPRAQRPVAFAQDCGAPAHARASSTARGCGNQFRKARSSAGLAGRWHVRGGAG